MDNIGRFIKTKREDAGFTQDKLAKACGLEHDSAINRIESGKRKVTWEELGEIARVLGNFHVFEALEAAGYITDEDIHPILKIRHLENLDNTELQKVQEYVDFLLYLRESHGKGVKVPCNSN